MISGIGNSSGLASQLFSRIDTKKQGYIEQSDLASAMSQTSGSSESSDVEALFSAFDTDSDGKVTESEFSSTLSKLQEELDGQYHQMRMQGMPPNGGPQGMGGKPPPPPDDAGFTKDELTSQLNEIGSSDDQRSQLISKIASNFDEADTDGDGKVSFKEAMAYDQANPTDSTERKATTQSDDKIRQQILQLMHAYADTGSQQNTTSSSLSVSA